MVVLNDIHKLMIQYTRRNFQGCHLLSLTTELVKGKVRAFGGYKKGCNYTHRGVHGLGSGLRLRLGRLV